MILNTNDFINEFQLRRADIAVKPISNEFDKIKILTFDEINSTNLVCRELAERNDPEKREQIVVAAKQFAGRGRLGRSFESPDGGLYMSLLLYPNMTAVDSQRITTAAAVAVCRAIERLDESLKPTIKWVNDIYLSDRKVCGILTGGQFDFESGAMAFAILGIGVNIWTPENGWPDEISNRAGALFGENTEKIELRPKLASLIAAEFYRLYPDLSKADIYDEYRERMFLIGREVTVIAADKSYRARVIGIDDELRLIVDNNGKHLKLSTGEVSLSL